MELKFTEMYDNEDSNNSNNVDNTSTNYWENNYNNRSTTTTTSKNKVTYDDILSSLNLVVSPNGVLQYMRVNKNNLPCNNSSSSCSSSTSSSCSSSNNLKSKNSSNSKSVHVQPNASIEPQLKHSYIYNKFFKDYKDNTIVEEPRQPMTREEYKKMIIEEQIKIRQARERAAMVKSTKMLFTNNNNNHISTPINVNRNQLNRLFRVNR